MKRVVGQAEGANRVLVIQLTKAGKQVCLIIISCCPQAVPVTPNMMWVTRQKKTTKNTQRQQMKTRLRQSLHRAPRGLLHACHGMFNSESCELLHSWALLKQPPKCDKFSVGGNVLLPEAQTCPCGAVSRPSLSVVRDDRSFPGYMRQQVLTIRMRATATPETYFQVARAGQHQIRMNLRSSKLGLPLSEIGNKARCL